MLAIQLYSIITVLVAVKSNALTTCNVRPDFSNYSTPTTGSALSGTLYFDINNPFTCYGIVKQWRFCYKRSPGIISDTLKIGLYQKQSSSYVKRGSNSITLQLQDSDCLTVDANPQLIVEQGYVLAFIATSIYIKFYDDPSNGHLFKTVAFPNQVLQTSLIKTTNDYVPKLQGYIENLQPTTSSETASSVLSTSSAMYLPPAANISTMMAYSSPSVIPIQSSALPYPDLQSNQCILGINQGYFSYFMLNSSWVLNYQDPCGCTGRVVQWELCFSFVSPISITLGIWRQESDIVTLVSQNEVFVHGTQDQFMCTTFPADSVEVTVGDLIGFFSPEVPIAFSELNDPYKEKSVPLLRAIIDKSSEQSTMTTALPSLVPSESVESVIITTSPRPSPEPPQRRGSSAAIAYGLAVGGLVILLVIIIALPVTIFVAKKKLLHKSIPSRSSSQDHYMAYNVNYFPSNPEEVIIENRKSSVRFSDNPSYGPSILGDSLRVGTGQENHIYESI